MTRSEIHSKICKLESEITSAIMNGHKSNDSDKFEGHRKELIELRCKYFGEDSKICKSYRNKAK